MRSITSRMVFSGESAGTAKALYSAMSRATGVVWASVTGGL